MRRWASRYWWVIFLIVVVCVVGVGLGVGLGLGLKRHPDDGCPSGSAPHGLARHCGPDMTTAAKVSDCIAFLDRCGLGGPCTDAVNAGLAAGKSPDEIYGTFKTCCAAEKEKEPLCRDA